MVNAAGPWIDEVWKGNPELRLPRMNGGTKGTHLVLDAFPGARIASVRDGRADHYGLLPDPAPSGEPGHIALVEPDLPEFAPPDAEPADMPDD